MGGDRAPAIAGAAFAARWSSKTLGALLDYMQAQMPLQSPGGLTRHQNADILAFILQRSGENEQGGHQAMGKAEGESHDWGS